MQQKRGMLLANETVKLIITAIVLVFLVGLLVKLYYGYTEDRDLQQAKATLERLGVELPNLVEDQPTTFEIYNPILNEKKDWFTGVHWTLFAWPTSGLMPKQCDSQGWESCICICQIRRFLANTGEEYLERCNAVGTCIESPSHAYVNNIVFAEGSGEIGYGFVPLTLPIGDDPPIIIKLEKTEDGIKITRP